jgi:predicted O-methyltransferase YrrM
MNLSTVINLVEKHLPMVRFEDLKVIIELLTYTKPKSILELGTGVGGWILAINEALNDDIFL